MENPIHHAIEMYEAGKSLDEIAQLLDMCYTTLRARLQTHGVEFRRVGPRRKKGSDEEDHAKKQQISQLYAQGIAGKRIAEELSMPYRRVFRILREMGTPIRQPGHRSGGQKLN